MTVIAQVRSLLSARYQTSIVRRAAVLMIFVGPAFLANLLVYYFTSRILSAENFGLFYVSITIGNVAYSGSLVLSVFFTRYLVRVGAAHPGDIVPATRNIQRIVGFWGTFLSFCGFALLIGLSKLLPEQSTLIALLIVADTFASYLADLGRAFLQSRRQTWQLGCYMFVWMYLRLALCVLGAFLFGTVWAALLGSALAATFVLIGFQIMLARAAIPTQHETPKLPPFTSLLPILLGYGILMIISNVDILLINHVLKGGAIGVYSASSVLPKGILVVTLPLSQSLFAIMMADQEATGIFRNTARKTIWVVAAFTVGASVVVWLLSPWLCGGRFGLALCEQAPLHILLISAVALSVLQITVLLEFARQRDWLVLSLSLPIVAYLLLVYFSKPGVEAMAVQFTIFAAATLAFFTAVQLSAAWWRGVGSPQSKQ